mgnify:CR=1 FL=1
MIRKKINCLKLILALLFLFFLIYQVSALDYESYLNEFSNDNEVCSVDDAFFYNTYNNELTLNVFYNCCFNSENCLLIPIDIQNRKRFQQNDIVELFHTEYMRDSIKSGNLKPDNYFPETADVCNYFGEKFNEQATSLSVEAGATFAPQKYKKTFQIIKTAGHASGLITEFDIGVFVLSVTCKEMSKTEKEAFLKVGECYQLLKQVEAGTSHYGISQEISTCNLDAKTKIKLILDSTGRKIKDVADTLFSVIIAFFRMIFDPIKDNQLNFKIDPTTYQAFQKLYDKISVENNYLNNPNAPSLTLRAEERLNQKFTESSSLYYPLKNRYDLIKKNISGAFSEFLSNKIMKPNLNQAIEREKLSKVSNDLETMKLWINEAKYNSAIKLGNNISIGLDDLDTYLKQHPKPDQKIDFFAIILFLIILGAIIYFAYPYTKDYFDKKDFEVYDRVFMI